MPWENWQSWHTYTLILFGIMTAIFAATYVAERREKLRRVTEAKSPAPKMKPTMSEFIASVELRRADIRANYSQMTRRYRGLNDEIQAITMAAEGGAGKLLAEKLRERAELGAEMERAKNELFKMEKFIRDLGGLSKSTRNSSN